MPPVHPITRIEQVARDLKQLAEQIADYGGQDARRALLYWRDELLIAVDELHRRSGHD